MKDKFSVLWKRYVNRETISYVIIGVLTTLVDWALVWLLHKKLGMDVLLANTFSTAAAILFAFVTNKFIVFQSMERDASTLGKEFVKFVGSRLLTYLLQQLMLWITVNKLGGDGMLMKIISSVVVIILNYFLSKLFIFTKKENRDEE